MGVYAEFLSQPDIVCGVGVVETGYSPKFINTRQQYLSSLGKDVSIERHRKRLPCDGSAGSLGFWGNPHYLTSLA